MSIVYVFVNPSFPDFVKIGRCKDVQKRLQSLSSNTALPLPFECVYACTVNNPVEVEHALHQAFKPCRVSPRREFFRMSPEVAIDLLKQMSTTEIEIERKIDPADDKFSTKFLETLYDEFTFDQSAVPLGATISFAKSPDVKCTVIGRNRVEFNRIECSFTDATKEALSKINRVQQIKISPSRYWTYEGEILAFRKHQRLFDRLKR